MTKGMTMLGRAAKYLEPALLLGKVGTPPWRKVELRDIPLPAPLSSVQPAAVVAVGRSDGSPGAVEPVARYDLA